LLPVSTPVKFDTGSNDEHGNEGQRKYQCEHNGVTVNRLCSADDIDVIAETNQDITDAVHKTS